MKTLGIVMDPISDINIKKDTSFAMLLAAQTYGYTLYYMEVGDLGLNKEQAFASMQLLTVKEDTSSWFELAEAETKPLSELDVILMRKDPPFDAQFLYSTYILERAEGALVINKPQSLRDANEKLFTAWFSDYTPETLVTQSHQMLQSFIEQHKDVILKPLDGMGGASIFRVKQDDPNRSVILETMTQHEQCFIMAQNYLPEIKQGDKRILIIDGEVIPYCLARIPRQGETRGNLAAGGQGVVQKLTQEELDIANAIAPELKARGLIFVGLDMIGHYITEINVTSPTCLREIEAASNINITQKFFEAIERRLQ